MPTDQPRPLFVLLIAEGNVFNFEIILLIMAFFDTGYDNIVKILT